MVAPFAYTLDACEWWQTNPPGPRGTFNLSIDLDGRGLDNRNESEIERLLDETRPLTRHIGTITFKNATRSAVPFVGTAALAGEVTTLYPRPDTAHLRIAATREVGVSVRRIERTRIA